ncbi:MAG: alginate export family protein [Abyssibacter sp.]|uniref:alginate export family protein n=1 Tax=Abyssibacter sp. TaxID=2320200 RepID=UPI00321A8816
MMKQRFFRAAVAGPFALLLPLQAMAAAPDATGLTAGQPLVDLRLRYERVEQDNALDDGDALTTRLRLGYTATPSADWRVLVEYEGVFATGGQDYNSGPGVLDSTNGQSGYSMIPDPTGAGINRAQLQYAPSDALKATLGRQRIVLDNARFVGNVGWRQNEQTFDGLRLQYAVTEQLSLDYSFLTQQNFIFFNDNEMSTHLLHARMRFAPALAVDAFGYWLDFDIDTGTAPRVPGAPDSQTLGLAASGQLGPLGYRASYAMQSEYADSPDTVDADYMQLELSYQLPGLKPSVGYEQLSGDGTYAFQTPFGTNHKFQGFADIFVGAIPSFGVEDTYASVVTKLGGVKLVAAWHQFVANTGGQDLGSELDLVVARNLKCGVSLLAKYADYSADTHAVDTRRIWLQTAYAF